MEIDGKELAEREKLDAIVQRCVELGVPAASVEYPGFIHVGHDDRYINFGFSNGNLGFDIYEDAACSEYLMSDEGPFDSNSTVEELAAFISGVWTAVRI